jgi:protein SCO1/2
MLRRYLLLICCVCSLAGCDKSSNSSTGSKAANSSGKAATNLQVFTVKGVIKNLQPDGKTVEIRHEEVPNYMPAMTMPFTAKNPSELKKLKPGDKVNFRMSVTEDDVWIDNINVMESAGLTNEIPSNNIVRIVRNVEPLQVGDPLPEYHFTNELGQAVSLSDYKGQALAISFIFTRCPLPTFCPRMSSNFQEVQGRLKSLSNFSTNWHLLTITFDPQFDTPPVLKAYAERFEADPAHWNFLTGDLTEITAIAEQFGELFWREQGSINHNLRTIIINTQGRVQNIIQGNTWTVDDLTQELKKATLP